MFSTPTVAGDLLHLGSCIGVFYALQLDSGTVRWRYNVSADSVTRQFHGDPLIFDSLIVIGTDAPADRRGYLFAFERATGKPRWSLEAGRGVTSDIVRRGSRGYAVSLDDELLCFELETGRVLWRFATGAINEGTRSSSPVLAGDRVFFVGLDWTVYALDADSGHVTWKRSLGARAATWPAIAGGTLVFAAEDGRLYRLEAESGAEVGRTPLGGGPYNGPIVPAGDSLLVLLGPGAVTCFDLRADRVRWSMAAAREWSSSRPYLWHSDVLAGTEDGKLHALGLSDGAVRWIHHLPGMIRGIGAAGDTLYVGTFKGRVYALRVTP